MLDLPLPSTPPCAISNKLITQINTSNKTTLIWQTNKESTILNPPHQESPFDAPSDPRGHSTCQILCPIKCRLQKRQQRWWPATPTPHPHSERPSPSIKWFTRQKSISQENTSPPQVYLVVSNQSILQGDSSANWQRIGDDLDTRCLLLIRVQVMAAAFTRHGRPSPPLLLPLRDMIPPACGPMVCSQTDTPKPPQLAPLH